MLHAVRRRGALVARSHLCALSTCSLVTPLQILSLSVPAAGPLRRSACVQHASASRQRDASGSQRCALSTSTSPDAKPEGTATPREATKRSRRVSGKSNRTPRRKSGSTHHQAPSSARTAPQNAAADPSAASTPLSISEAREAAVSAESAGRGDSGEVGWSFETVDEHTGKTALDVLYDNNLERIHRILERPLPPLPPDGHVHPDFFIGFAHYNYRLRDEYRAVLAQELRVPVKAISLSVAWGGRFDVSAFNRVRKVCGVCLDRTLIRRSSAGARAADAASTTPASHEPTRTVNASASADKDDDTASTTPPPQLPPLPAELQARVDQLVRSVNARRSERLLHCQFLQASGAVAEVEFAYTRKEHRLLVKLNDWLCIHVLRRSLAVIVVGGNGAFAGDGANQAGNSVAAARAPGPASDAAAALDRRAQSAQMALHRHASECREQRQYVAAVWKKPLLNRHVVAYEATLGELATQLARAVLAGDVSAVRVAGPPGEDGGDASNEGGSEAAGAQGRDADENVLPAPLQELLLACAGTLLPRTTANSASEDVAAVASTRVQGAPNGDGERAGALFDDATYFAGQAPSVQAAAGQWLQLVRDALFLEQGEAGLRQTPSRQTHTRDGVLPALFVHGAYAGGLMEMRYLRSNRAAMDAMLLHPNDITLKRAFASRLRSGHQRLRLHEELSAAQHTT